MARRTSPMFSLFTESFSLAGITLQLQKDIDVLARISDFPLQISKQSKSNSHHYPGHHDSCFFPRARRVLCSIKQPCSSRKLICTRVRSKSPASSVPRAPLHNELTSASARSGLRHSSVSAGLRPT